VFDESVSNWIHLISAFAQEALGHNSKAVHRAYAKRALMETPSLEEYEQRATATP
jgi:hypothetical protein